MDNKPSVGFHLDMDQDLKRLLDEYCNATGRTRRFVAENGIQIAILTDCRYSNETEMVDVVTQKGIYKVPRPVAEELQRRVDLEYQTKHEGAE